MEEQWRFGEERALGRRKNGRGGETTGWRKRNNEAKLIFGERLYVMGQVIWVGPLLA